MVADCCWVVGGFVGDFVVGDGAVGFCQVFDCDEGFSDDFPVSFHGVSFCCYGLHYIKHFKNPSLVKRVSKMVAEAGLEPALADYLSYEV